MRPAQAGLAFREPPENLPTNAPEKIFTTVYWQTTKKNYLCEK